MIDIYILDPLQIINRVKLVLANSKQTRQLNLYYRIFEELYLNNTYRQISQTIPTLILPEKQIQIQQFTNYYQFKQSVDQTIIEHFCASRLDLRINTLTVSSVYYCGLDRIIKHVSDQCRFISTINIRCNEATDGVLELVLKAQWRFMVIFDCSTNQITSEGVKYLSECSWPFLRELNLKQNKITNQGLKYLARTNWPALADLIIKENRITTDGLKNLCKCRWGQLKYLNIDGKLGNEGLKIIQRFLPKKLAYIILEENIVYSPNKFKCFYNINQLAKQDLSIQCKLIAPYEMVSPSAYENLSINFKIEHPLYR